MREKVNLERPLLTSISDGSISLYDEHELIELAESKSALCENFGMKLCKFVLNSRNVVESVQPCDKA